MPFDGNYISDLNHKIMKGSYPSVPSEYSKNIKMLLHCMLIVDEKKRPTINEILKLTFIKDRIRNFLTESEIKEEFSDKKKHNFKFLKLAQTKKDDKKPEENTKNNEVIYAGNDVESAKKIMSELTNIEKDSSAINSTFVKNFEEGCIVGNESGGEAKLEDLKEKLMKELGEAIYKNAFQIVDNTVERDLIICDFEKIKNALKEKLKVEEKLLNVCYEKIQDLFSLVIKEREINFLSNKKK